MAITSTTLSAAITSSDRTMTVASATGITYSVTAPVLLRIDDEFIEVTAALNGTTVPIGRGRQGTRAQAHGNGRVVYIGTASDFTSAGFQYNAAKITSRASGLFYQNIAPATVTTAGAATYTVGQVLSGLILDDPNGAARTRTLPTAALLVAAIPGADVNTAFEFTIRNDADAAETITVAGGTGGTTSGTMTIAQNNMKRFLLRFTAVDSGNEAYTVYSLGTVVS